MSLKPLLLLAALLLPACSSAPARPDDLTPVRDATPRLDFAPEGVAGEIPFATARHGDVVIACNLQQEPVAWGGRTWARLLFRNEGEGPLRLRPTLRLVDGNGLPVPSVARDAFLRGEIGDPEAQTETHPVRQATGAARTLSPFAGFFGLGPLGPVAALADVIGGVATEDTVVAPGGLQRAEWALTHWMPEELTIPAGEARGGVVAFVGQRALPLRLEIGVAGGEVVFVSRAKIAPGDEGVDAP